jgi:hypothetical protein
MRYLCNTFGKIQSKFYFYYYRFLIESFFTPFKEGEKIYQFLNYFSDPVNLIFLFTRIMIFHKVISLNSSIGSFDLINQFCRVHQLP